MSKPHPRAYRYALVFLLALALSAVFTTNAQSSLTQTAQSTDGQISIHLPDGWQASSTTAPIFSSVLAFGDSSAAVKAAVASLTSTTAPTQAQMTGIIGILNPAALNGMIGDLAASSLLNAMVASVQQQGGQITQQQTAMIGGKYSGTVAVGTIPGEDTAGIFGVFQAGTNIVEFTMGASPAADFDADQSLFFDILDSVSIPAETGAPVPQPAPATVSAPLPSGQGGVVAGKSATFSIRLPEGYVSEPITVSSFADILAFGSSSAVAQAMVQTFTAGATPNNFNGVGGIIGEVDSSLFNGQTGSTLVAPLMQSMLASVQASGNVSIVQPPQAHTFGGQYAGQLAELNLGYLGVVNTDQHLLVVLVMSDNVAANRAAMDGILDSIRIPAEAAVANPPEVATAVPVEPTFAPTTIAPEPTNVSAAPLQTLRSSDNQVSLDIPGDWNFLDHVADGSILAYGDTFDAAMSRLYSVKPALATETIISGMGGVVVLYPMSQFGIDSSAPDLTALMNRALGNLQGYTVEQAAQPLAGSDDALYAVINGTEHGYLALIPFGDQIAYVTATVANGDDFQANAAALMAIVQSVHVPAIAEPTPVPTASGLGGLGGLEATAEATPESTPAGLSGL